MDTAAKLRRWKSMPLVCALALQGLFCAPATLHRPTSRIALTSPLSLSQAHLCTLSQQLIAVFSAQPNPPSAPALPAITAQADTVSFTNTKILIDSCHNHAINLLTLSPLTFEGVGAVSRLHGVGLILLYRINPPTVMPIDNEELRARNIASLSPFLSNLEVHLLKSTDFSADHWVVGLASGGSFSGRSQEFLAGQIFSLAESGGNEALVQIVDIWFATDLNIATLQAHCEEWYQMMPITALKPKVRDVTLFSDAGAQP
jgi:hypothetical protein